MTASDPARFVADADVLAADLLIGGEARTVLDLARAHEWVTLVASEALLEDAAAVIESLGNAGLAADWRGQITELAEIVSHPPDDHPGLASAIAGEARHLLTFDPGLLSPSTNVSLRERVAISIRHPDAFALLFEPESMYETVEGGSYPGRDSDPRQ